ncbi:predicted protein [Streptomyces albidoflavus]|nr:predicted protein [Streptomyces albidoflavus]
MRAPGPEGAAPERDRRRRGRTSPRRGAPGPRTPYASGALSCCRRPADEPHLGVSGGGSVQRLLAQGLGRRGTATRVPAHPNALQVQRPAQPFGQPAPSRRPLEDTPTQPVRRLRTSVRGAATQRHRPPKKSPAGVTP